jgi:putative heme-binding domain-containing protein
VTFPLRLAAASVVLATLGAALPSSPAGAVGGDRGQRLFDVHCARCHGIHGTGGEGPPLTLALLRRAPDDDTLVDVIQNGIPRTAMIGSFALSDDEAALVAAYVRSLGRVESAVAATGDAERGRAIYDENACSACHIVSGDGRGIGPELTAIGALRGVEHLRASVLDAAALVAEEYRLVSIRTAAGAAVRGLRVNQDDASILVRDADARLHSLRVGDLSSLRLETGVSLMPSYAGRLSSEEIEHLVAYLASLRGAP